MKKQKLVMLMYALGSLGLALTNHIIIKWYQYYYSPPVMNRGELKILVPLSLIGLAMVVGRLVNGVVSPLMAYFSDSSKSKRGRRIPFILYGSIALLISFILVWFPPVAGESVINFIYLMVILCIFCSSWAVVSNPYYALIVEITKTGEERIKLTMMLGLFQVLGLIIAEVGSSILIGIYNFRIMGLTLGLFGVATIIFTPLFVKENELHEINNKPIGILKSLKMTCTNKNFILYLVPLVGIWFGVHILTISTPYICEVLLGIKAESSGFMIAGAYIVAILFSSLMPKFTLKFGKKRVMMAAAVLYGLILLCTGLFGTLFNQIAATIIIWSAGVPLAVMLVIPNAMLADVAEMDSIENGQRREGMFFATEGLVMNLIFSLSSLAAPFIFRTFGYSVAKPLGLQLCGPISGVLVLICVLFLNAYSLSEEILEAAKRDQANRAIN